MTAPSLTPRRIAAAVVAAAAIAAGAVGCSGGSSSPPSPASPSVTRPVCATTHTPGFPAVDRCSVESVLQTAAARIFSFLPAQQSSTADSFWAAGPLLDPMYQAQVGDSAAMLAPVTAGQWQRWAAEHAHIDADARVTSDEHPTPTTRVVAVTQHITGPGGQTLEPDQTVVLYMAATRASDGAPYAVSQITVR